MGDPVPPQRALEHTLLAGSEQSMRKESVG
jgi:hypothetical protein